MKGKNTMKKIEKILWDINTTLGYKTNPYSEEKNVNRKSWMSDFRMVPNVGTFFVTNNMNGYVLNQIERGGSKIKIEALTKKELKFILIGMKKGINALENKLK